MLSSREAGGPLIGGPPLGLSQTVGAVAGVVGVADGRPELRRRITYLMLFRVVLITVVLGMTVALNAPSPDQLAAPHQLVLFAIIGATYALTLIYAYFLPRVAQPLRFADAQLVGDLVVTSILVYATGAAQSGYTFFYPLSIVGAATVRYRRGALVATAASIVLLVAVSMVDRSGGLVALRQLTLNVGACLGIGVLSSLLGAQLAQSGERLAVQRVRAADLAILKEYIIRSLSSGLLTVDKEGAVMTVNQSAAEILELEEDAALGRRITDLLPGLQPLLAGLGERQSVRRGEISAARGKGGDLALGVTVSPLMDHRGQAIGRVLNFQDLTELRRMEAQVKRAERLAVIGGVAAAVAHEIRNPLASISGSIELLRSAPQVDDESRQLMDIVVREVDRLNSLVGDLLDYARPRDRLTMQIELGDVLDETVRVFAQDRTFAHVKVRTAIDQAVSMRPVIADPAQLRQVMWNLLRNAAEAMPDGGEVRVELEQVDGWIEVRVVDTGLGISPEGLEHIFEPFYTTKSRGTGLGLATVQRILTEHGGSIHIASSLGDGTTVTLRLPFAS